MLLEESALLRTVGNTHLDSCQAVKTSSRSLLGFIENLIPIAENSKVQKNPWTSFKSFLVCYFLQESEYIFVIRLHWIGFYLIVTVLSSHQVAVLISLSHSIWFSCYARTLINLQTLKIKFHLFVKTVRKAMLEMFFSVTFLLCLKRYPCLYSSFVDSVYLFPDASLANRLCLEFLESS